MKTNREVATLALAASAGGNAKVYLLFTLSADAEVKRLQSLAAGLTKVRDFKLRNKHS
jgi:hypothetical protein